MLPDIPTLKRFYLVAMTDSNGETALGPYTLAEARRAQGESRIYKIINAEQLRTLRARGATGQTR